MPFAPIIEISALNGTDGFQLIGEAAGALTGVSVSSAGDINGDGIDDFIVGADGVAGRAGAAYIVFGTGTAFGPTFNVSALNGTNGFQITGTSANDYAGHSVDAIGDVNNDGFADVLIGTPGEGPGVGYVLFGKNTAVSGAFAAEFNVSTLTGTTGYKIVGTGATSFTGIVVGGGGDYNGDGIEDMILGASSFGGGYVGRAYVVFGRNGSPGATLDVTTLNGANGFAITNPFSQGLVGATIATTAGDINGDGFDDIVFSSRTNGYAYSSPGKVYVIYGKNTAVSGNFAASISLNDINASNGATFTDNVTYGSLGYSADIIGDINGDGFDDLGIGGLGSDAFFIVFGKNTAVSGAFGLNFDLNTLNGTNGFKVVDPGEFLGKEVQSAGDINRDGYDDILFSSWDSDVNGTNTGVAWVVFGHGGAFSASLSLTSLNGTTGFRMDGEAVEDRLLSVAGIGDVNNDGTDDLIVSTHQNDANGANSGSAWIIYGIPSGPTTPVGTPGNDDLSGGPTGETIDGGNGYDIIDGNGGDDTLSGGNNNDLLNGGDNDDILNGDAGGDTLNGDAGDDELHGGTGADKLYGGGDQDILGGEADNDYLYGGDQNDALAGGDGNDYLDGGTGTDGMIGGDGNDVYIVDSTSDIVAEAFDEGYDIIRSTVSIAALAANVEGLQLQGVGNLNGTGNGLANNIQGNSGNNTLDGGAGVDTINGGDGNDRIIGGTGNDLLRGGTGADVFAVSHAFSGAIETDIVYDYLSGENDIIDLSGIDANGAGAGNTAFTVVGAFSKTAGEMIVVIEGGNTVIKLDTTGDGKVDYQMKINGDVTADVGDWIL